MIRTALGFVAFLFGAVPATAAAAPQILGLTASGGAVPMQCADGECIALLSAFCLQQRRLPPDFETAYRPGRPGDVVLVMTMPDGLVQRRDAAGLVRFSSRYGYTAVESRLTLSDLGAPTPASVALETAPRATMLPVAVPGDPDPLTPEEIALAAGPARLAAEAVFEGNEEGARTARIAARLINALPVEGDVAATARADIWNRAGGTDGPLRARRMFEACGRTVDQSVGYSLRTCLEERHEKLQIEATQAFWESLGGS